MGAEGSKEASGVDDGVSSPIDPHRVDHPVGKSEGSTKAREKSITLQPVKNESIVEKGELSDKQGSEGDEASLRQPGPLATVEDASEHAKIGPSLVGTKEEKPNNIESFMEQQQQKTVEQSTDLQLQHCSSTLLAIEEQLLQLVESSASKRIPLNQVRDLYKATFSSQLDIEKFGYKKLLDFVSSLSSLSHERGVVIDEIFLVPSSNNNGSHILPAQAVSAQANDSSSEPEEAVSDLCAAVECLWAFRRDFQQRKWPSSGTQVTKFLDQLDAGTDPKLASWASRLRNEGLGMGKIRKRLAGQLARMHCLKKKKNKYVWNVPEVDAILASRTSSSNANGSEAATTGVHAVSLAGVKLIESMEQLQELKEAYYPFKRPEHVDNKDVVAVDCEGVPESLFLIQMATPKTTFVFDCVKLDAKVVCDFLRGLLSDRAVTKLFHDLHNDSAALSEIGGVDQLCGTLDTQLAMESLTGDLHMGFNRMLEELGQQKHATKTFMKGRMQNEQLFAQRPLPPDVLQYAVDDVRLLVNACESLRAMLGESWDSIQHASDARALAAARSGGARQICFDVSNSYALSSLELLQEVRPGDMLNPTPLEVSNEASTLLAMLPKDLADALSEYTHDLSDVVLDKGRRPHAWVGGSRLMLGDDDRLVDPREINSVVDRLGGFGTDNRAGLERQLHRISAIRNRASDIIGLTLRFGRHVSGNTGIISDLLFGDSPKSILFLGEPGSGKTTVVREVTRLLAERSNVCIVDTSNEIAGDGDIPHPCVGFARRMMVPSLDAQSAVMIECVQNHTPEVMIVDEIGRPTEVEAARTCKNRGVRLIASAHGDLRKLIKNPKLRGLIGGVENVTLGDVQAKVEARKRPGNPNGIIPKVKAERAGPPTFDVLIELKRGAHHEWRVVLNAADAVDRVLRGEAYKAQRRTRDPRTGAIHLDLEKA